MLMHTRNGEVDIRCPLNLIYEVEPMENIYYNYIYLDPRKPGNYQYSEYFFDYEPFYVGKGKGRRYKAKHNKATEIIISDIRNGGLDRICRFLGEELEENVAYNMENKIVKCIGRSNLGLGPLTNLADGGRRPVNVIFTEEYKRKLSESHKRENLSEETRQKLSEARKRTKHSEETKRKMSEAKKGEKNPQFGKKLSEETKWKLSDALKGRNNPMYGRKHSEETKAIIRAKRMLQTMKQQ